jgi:hypothetical protein
VIVASKTRRKPDAGRSVGRKLAASPHRHRDSASPARTARYACLCEVRRRHGAHEVFLVLWDDTDQFEQVPVSMAYAASTVVRVVVVAENPWRALTEEDIEDIWRLAPPGSVLRPIHAQEAASILVECPDGTFSHIAASPVVSNIPGAMRLAYGDDAPSDTWAIKRPFHLHT